MDTYGTERLEQILLRIDEETDLVFCEPHERFKVVIVGGSACMLFRLTRRPATHDIDVLEADRRLVPILNRYRMVNGAVRAHSDEIPYNFEDRLCRVDLPTKAIDFFVPSIEDLAVMKLYAWRPNDEEDLTSPAFLEKLDWDRLKHLVYADDEARASCQSDRRYQEMILMYERYAERYCHEADL